MTEFNSILLLIVVALLSLVSYLIDGYRKALERKIEALERLIESHLDSSWLHNK